MSFLVITFYDIRLSCFTNVCCAALPSHLDSTSRTAFDISLKPSYVIRHIFATVCDWMASLSKSSSRFSPPWSSISWTHSGGATTSCPTSGTPASTTWWARPSVGTKTDLTANRSFRSQELSWLVHVQMKFRPFRLAFRYVSMFFGKTGNGRGPLPEASQKWE